MRIKQKPEDFSVKESYRFDEVPSGKYRIYLMDKQKLSTFDAVRRLTERFGLRPDAISYCGLKDKQGRTEQIIAVDGADVDLQEPDLRLKFLARSDKPLTARNTTSNRFSVTIRMLREDEVGKLPLAAADVNRLGVVNYFDDQRFGSLKHGQGFIAKDLIRGDFERALKNYMAKPSPLDRSDDAKVKDWFQKNWGKWDRPIPFAAAKKYERVIRVLRKTPDDFVNAFLQIDANYRAILLFTYQSYLWNECVRRLLQLALPREHLFVMRYQAGTLLFHQDADPEVLEWLRTVTVPLLGPTSTFTDPKVKEAVEWVLGKEKLKLEQLRIEKAPRMLYFKHEERPVIIYPQKVVVGKTREDEINEGFYKSNVAFTLPPGSYATLVVKRLFHFSELLDSEQEDRAKSQERAAKRAAEAADLDVPDEDLDDADLGGEIVVEGGGGKARPRAEREAGAGPGPGAREGRGTGAGESRGGDRRGPPGDREGRGGDRRGPPSGREGRGGERRGPSGGREGRGGDRGAFAGRGAGGREAAGDRGGEAGRREVAGRSATGRGGFAGRSGGAAAAGRGERGAGAGRGVPAGREAREERAPRAGGDRPSERYSTAGRSPRPAEPIAVREIKAPETAAKGFLERQREKKATRETHRTEAKPKK